MDFIRDARQPHGLRRLSTRNGDPLLPRVRSRYLAAQDTCNELGIRHVTFTNTLCLNEAAAQQLRERRASLCMKLNGMTADVHDYLVGLEGAHARALHAFGSLLRLGYGLD